MENAERIDQKCYKISKNDLVPLVDFVNTYFDGNMYQLSKFLDKSIYWLHHIPESDLFSQRERQDICFALFELREALVGAFFEQQSKQY